MTDAITLRISEQFSPYPGGRHPKDGPFSGQHFRDDVLAPLLLKHAQVNLVFDGLAGLPSSFLEEVFGGLIRKGLLTLSDIGTRLKLEAEDPELKVYIPIAMKYARDASLAQP